jgi:hypothetical protein
MTNIELECRMAWLDAYVKFLFEAYYRKYPPVLYKQLIINLDQSY